MLAIERKNEILAILQKEQRVLVSELSKRYDVTDETIRRDLEKLEIEGYVKRTYGGAGREADYRGPGGGPGGGGRPDHAGRVLDLTDDRQGTKGNE